MLEDRIRKLRGRGPFDALVGFSGGKDSCYVVNTLVRKYKLKVLALTFDNGFLTEYARTNVQRLVRQLGVEHCFYKPDHALQRAFYRAALDAYGDPCIACAIPIYCTSIKLAHERRIPLVVHGRSPFQIYRNDYPGSPDIFLELHDSNYQTHSFENLGALYRMLDAHVHGWLEKMFPADAPLRNRIYREFFLDPQQLEAGFAPDFIGLFQYEAYDEERIKRQLERDTGYCRPKEDELLGHGDCSIHDACGHLFYRIHGASATEVEVAAMLRQGALDPSTADRLLARKLERDRRRPEASIAALCNYLGITQNEFDGKAEELGRRIKEKFCCH